MSPMVALHATNPKCRESIFTKGLLAGMPYMFSSTGRYKRTARSPLQCMGVYVYSDDGSFNHPTYGKPNSFRCVWGGGPGMDIWQASYIGPVSDDPFVENALIFHECIPPQHLSLITHITHRKGHE